MAYLASFSFTSFFAFIRQLTWQPDIVLLVEPTLFCAPHTLLFALLTRSVSWLHIQDFEVDVAFRLNDLPVAGISNWATCFERSLLRRFDRVSTISNRMLQRLSEKGLPRDQMVFLPNWVDVSEIYPSDCGKSYRMELGIPPDSIVALYSGNMGLKQGLDVLAEVCSLTAHRRDITFVFCGDGPYKNRLAHQLRGFKNAVMIPLQPKARLNELLNLADIHLLPQVEGAEDLVMPSKLAGMMASGRPVIATASIGSEVSAAVETRGIVTPLNNPRAFAAAILTLANAPEERASMGEKARVYAVTHLNKTEILKRCEQLMLQSCGQGEAADHSGRPKDRARRDVAIVSATISGED